MTRLQRSALPASLCLAMALAASCADLIAPIDPVVATCSAENPACSVGFLCTDGLCLRSTIARCGDGEVQDETSEECDDGNDDANDRCNNCRVTYCGDDIAQHSVGEECDDGNRINTDACTADCAWARCGDGITRSDSSPGSPNHEDCDDANTEDHDRCTNDCLAARCGDGWVLEGIEPCDDGNDIDDDDCSNTCGLGIVEVVAGGAHTCARSERGLALCWGSNAQGQLGDGSQTDRFTPVPVAGLSDVARLFASARHSCAIKLDGSLWCWGATIGLEPVALGVPQTWTEVAVISHRIADRRPEIMALNRDGALFRMVKNHTTLEFDVLPIDVPESLTTLGASWEHACALSVGGHLYCFGRNDNGELGLGDNAPSSVEAPTRVALSDVTSVAVLKSGSCATNRAGQLYCWGRPWLFGSGGDRRSPTLIADLPPVASVFGQYKNIGLRLENGALRTFDQGNALVPIIPASAPPNYAAPASLAIGPEHVCALSSNRRIACWGVNSLGQLGTGMPYRTRPSPVANLMPAEAVAVGVEHSCARMRDGSVRCWGYNENGERHDGAGHASSDPPSLAAGLSKVAQLRAGGTLTCALFENQTGTCWPGDYLSTDGNSLWPEMLGASRWETLAVGHGYLCTIDLEERPRCGGRNALGQLGDGTLEASNSLVDVQGLDRVQSIAAGPYHNCAGDAEGMVWCWGVNLNGQCGSEPVHNDNRDVVPRPQRVAGLGPTRAVSAGRSHSCAITQADEVVCWGYNMEGGLGIDDLNTINLERRPVAGLSAPPVAIEAFDHSTCTLLQGGDLLCWGRNATGQLGDGSGLRRTQPSRVVDLPPIKQMDGLTDHACAVATNGSVYCWGRNNHNQLGGGRSADSATPRELPLY